MLRTDAVGGVVKIDKIARADIDGADTEAHCAGIDQIEIHKSFERRLQRSDIVIANRFDAAARLQVGRRHAWRKEARCAAQQRS